MNCPYCHKPAEWVPNEVVYGKRYGKSWMVWLCRCLPNYVYVGCHKNTRRPLGTMANSELRGWRRKAHKAFDPIWQDREMKRPDAYAWLAGRMKVAEAHVGEFDIAQCQRVIQLAGEFFRNMRDADEPDYDNSWADGHPLDYGDR